MDCDDQVRVVKRDHDPDADATDITHEARPSICVGIGEQRPCDDALDVGIGHPQPASLVLGMSRVAHRLDKADARKILPYS